MDLMHFTFVELGKWTFSGKFDKANQRDAWLLFFTQPEAMYQAYTRQELETLEELHAAVNAWDLSKYTLQQLWTMDKQIDPIMLREAIAHDEYMEAKAEGVAVAFSVFKGISDDATVSDEVLSKESGLSVEQVRELRTAFEGQMRQ